MTSPAIPAIEFHSERMRNGGLRLTFVGQLDAVTTGQIFTANQALEHGLVDKIGFVEEAIERATELANLTTKDVRCVKYEESPTLVGVLMGADAPVPALSSIDFAAVAELMTPRAYYLWTSLPAMLSNTR